MFNTSATVFAIRSLLPIWLIKKDKYS